MDDNFDDFAMDIEGNFLLQEQDKIFKKIYIDGQRDVMNKILDFMETDWAEVNKTKSVSEDGDLLKEGMWIAYFKLRTIIQESMRQLEIETDCMNTTKQANA